MSQQDAGDTAAHPDRDAGVGALQHVHHPMPDSPGAVVCDCLQRELIAPVPAV